MLVPLAILVFNKAQRSMTVGGVHMSTKSDIKKSVMQVKKSSSTFTDNLSGPEVDDRVDNAISQS